MAFFKGLKGIWAHDPLWMSAGIEFFNSPFSLKKICLFVNEKSAFSLNSPYSWEICYPHVTDTRGGGLSELYRNPCYSWELSLGLLSPSPLPFCKPIILALPPATLLSQAKDCCLVIMLSLFLFRVNGCAVFVILCYSLLEPGLKLEGAFLYSGPLFLLHSLPYAVLSEILLFLLLFCLEYPMSIQEIWSSLWSLVPTASQSLESGPKEKGKHWYGVRDYATAHFACKCIAVTWNLGNLLSFMFPFKHTNRCGTRGCVACIWLWCYYYLWFAVIC